MTANLRKLKKAHCELMARYIDILNEVSKLPLFQRVQPGKPFAGGPFSQMLSWIEVHGQERKPATDYFALRFLVKLFVESHIKNKLKELSVSYSYLAQKVQNNEKFTTWLKETSAECEKVAATLTSWQSITGVASVLWPVIPGVIVARLEIESIYEVVNKININTAIVLDAMFWSIFPLIYLMIFMSSSFRYKRQLFMPDFDPDGTVQVKDQPASLNRNVYYLEDQVFDIAGRGKAREMPLDLISRASGMIGFAVYLLLLILDNRTDIILIIFSAVFAAIFLYEAVAFIIHARRRQWN